MRVLMSVLALASLLLKIPVAEATSIPCLQHGSLVTCPSAFISSQSLMLRRLLKLR
jgi:hypothetical protein